MIIVVGTILVKPECREDALKLSLNHVHRSREEPGCIRHDVSLDAENSLRFIFVEYWRDMAALQAHFALQKSQDFVRELSVLLTEKPVMKIFDSEEVRAG